MAKVVKLTDLSKEIESFGQATLAEQREAVVSGIARSIPDLVKASPVDTGLYAASWNFDVDEERAILGNTAPHAAIIEFGARPFTPPLKPLLEWAKRVLKDPSQPPYYSPEVQSLARGVQKKISVYGMQPRHVLNNMIPQIIENIRQELNRGK